MPPPRRRRPDQQPTGVGEKNRNMNTSKRQRSMRHNAISSGSAGAVGVLRNAALRATGPRQNGCGDMPNTMRPRASSQRAGCDRLLLAFASRQTRGGGRPIRGRNPQPCSSAAVPASAESLLCQDTALALAAAREAIAGAAYIRDLRPGDRQTSALQSRLDNHPGKRKVARALLRRALRMLAPVPCGSSSTVS